MGAGQSLVKTLMWARPVVVDEELMERRLKMAVAEDEQLSACGPDPALRE